MLQHAGSEAATGTLFDRDQQVVAPRKLSNQSDVERFGDVAVREQVAANRQRADR